MIYVKIKNNQKKYFMFLSNNWMQKKINNNMINLWRLSFTNLHSHLLKSLLSFLSLTDVVTSHVII